MLQLLRFKCFTLIIYLTFSISIISFIYEFYFVGFIYYQYRKIYFTKLQFVRLEYDNNNNDDCKNIMRCTFMICSNQGLCIIFV